MVAITNQGNLNSAVKTLLIEEQNQQAQEKKTKGSNKERMNLNFFDGRKATIPGKKGIMKQWDKIARKAEASFHVFVDGKLISIPNSQADRKKQIIQAAQAEANRKKK